MTPINWGVLSTAKIGVVKVIPAMQQGKGGRILGLASRDRARAAEVAAKLGIPKSYGSYEALLADPEIDAVYNPLPNHLHVPWTLKALAAGKHVLCEKPIALNAAEAGTLIRARDASGRQVLEAFMVRQHPQWLRARELVRAGRIGALRAISTVFAYHNVDPANVRNQADIGGGGLYDIGCYAVVTARFIMEAEPTRVVATIERDPNFRTDRLSSALMDFPGGRQVTFTCSTQMVPYQRVQIFGTTGRIEVAIPFNAPPDRPCRITVDGGAADGSKAEVEEFPVCDQYTFQGEEAARIFKGEIAAPFPIEDAVANMVVIDALFKSAETGAWIVLARAG
ncbi:MAG: Gfo/Idh/MocA family oxidoreductase [Proteobacteria bacterium]|nr:Gfo/Idh/MocA family oxidoreductase [Pseudomonadota bacterium]MBI3496697.1 Gfo/Idh/MocA family oxidoreductase [Pseudomonadota bacterium]